MVTIPSKFSSAKTFSDKILFVLSLMHKGSANEIANEIADLDGISSEEGLAELVITTKKKLEKLRVQETVGVVKEHRQKKRFALCHALSKKELYHTKRV
ncbi:hypothetical protein HRH25_23410 [Flavisolibacter sp. BT320]|nr:hypothetical protein [Flavisolibacter longurius]